MSDESVKYCKRGHALTPENVIKRSDNHGIRCRICTRDNKRRYRNYQGKPLPKDRTHCPQGHEYTVENTYIRPDKKGRDCQICRSVASKKVAAKKPKHPRSSWTHCSKGHEFTEDNTSYTRGKRVCLRCHALYEHMRRQEKLGLDMNYTAKDEQITRMIFNHRCFKCLSADGLEIDHHYPLSKGFGLSLSNAVILCESCNASKNDRHPAEFYSSAELATAEYLLALAEADFSGDLIHV